MSASDFFKNKDKLKKSLEVIAKNAVDEQRSKIMSDYEISLIKDIQERFLLMNTIKNLPVSSYNQELLDFLDYQIEKIQEDIDFHKEGVC